ncbi:unnamed protein product [Prorocentrum cordatum]|uniref:Uncharacterized protein n=1 Tax=Prorocentrum cordatum TaxID=2364126 RepID=A0ABN9TZX9_9DINO|nr:unnamed protein product [Polarella glacialis]
MSAHGGDDEALAPVFTQDRALEVQHRPKGTLRSGGGPGAVAFAPAARSPPRAQAWSSPQRPALGGPALGGPTLGGPSHGRVPPLAFGAAAAAAPSALSAPLAGAPVAAALGPRPTQHTPARPLGGKPLRDPAAADALFRQLPARAPGPATAAARAKSRPAATRSSSSGGVPVRRTSSDASTASASGRWL